MRALIIACLITVRHLYAYNEYLRTYNNSGLPRHGLLYNHGSHGFVSMPKFLGIIQLRNIVIIGRKRDKKLGISIFQPNSGRNMYNLRVVSLKSANQRTNTVLAMTSHGTLSKVSYNERNPSQYFEILLSKRYRGYFQIVYHGYCLTPNRRQVLTLSECWTDRDRLYGKQLFKVYETNNVNDSERDSLQPIIIKPGISPYYFQDCAPCNRYIADPSIGKYILIDKKFCDENCSKSEFVSVDKQEPKLPTMKPRPAPASDDESSSSDSKSEANPPFQSKKPLTMNSDPVDAVNAAIKIKDMTVPKVPGLSSIMDTVPNVIRNMTKK